MEKHDRASRKHRTSIPQATKQWFLIWCGPTATPDESQPPTPDLRRDKHLAKIETIAKLRQFGLSDEQIAESLGLTLEEVKQVDSEG